MKKHYVQTTAGRRLECNCIRGVDHKPEETNRPVEDEHVADALHDGSPSTG